MISIIIPTYNEAKQIGKTIRSLLNEVDKKFINEIIIADGGSKDDTINIAKSNSVITIQAFNRQRATQLNVGAAIAKSDILFFLHADSIPDKGFAVKIVEAVNKNYGSGCFRLLFDNEHWFLKANAWFTKFNINAFRFGDQGLFITKDVFKKCGGYNEDLTIMEDQEIIHRIKKISSFKVLKGFVTTSARKYVQNGVYKTQGIFFVIWLLYYFGLSQKGLLKLYKSLTKQNK